MLKNKCALNMSRFFYISYNPIKLFLKYDTYRNE